MNKQLLEYRGRTAEGILNAPRASDAGWYVYQARSWIDYCARKQNINGLFYAAFDLRQAIEQVWYIHIIVHMYDSMTRKKYEHYARSHKKIRRFMEKIKSKYEKLTRFTNLCIRQESSSLRIIEWDITRLISAHRHLSNYHHFQGMENETWENDTWLKGFTNLLEDTSVYLWDELSSGGTGILDEVTMQPEVLTMWELFRNNELSEEDCIGRLRIAGPTFRHRQIIKDSLTTI
jgi:hypothetical protein